MQRNCQNLNGDAVTIEVMQPKKKTYFSYGPAKLSSILSLFRTDLFATRQINPMHFSGGSGQRHQNCMHCLKFVIAYSGSCLYFASENSTQRSQLFTQFPVVLLFLLPKVIFAVSGKKCDLVQNNN